MINEFLDVVYGEAEGRASVWWRKRPGQKSPIDSQKWFAWPDERDEMIEFIDQKSALDVYVPVALFKEDRRIPEAATTTNTIWQDADAIDPADYRLPPSVIVETSPGRYHCWWTLDQPYPADQTELVTRKVTYCHKDSGADVSSWGRNKLLRVPGTYNSSHGFPEEVKARFTGAIYTLQELADAYDDVPIPVGPAAKMRTDTATPAPTPDDLPDFMAVQSKLPEDFPIDLITREPGAENRSEMRWKLIAELVEAGLTDEETFVIAWKAKCSSKWWDDPRGENGLWAEIAKERQKYEWGSKVEEPVASKTPRRSAKRKPVEILTKEERAHARRVFQKTWIHEYEEWVKARVKIYNAPYHRAGAWMALSNLVGETARLNIGGNDIPLGLYFFVLGGTTTGKSQAKGFMRRTIHHGYHDEAKNPDVGDDVSIAALQDVLRDREHGAGLMSSDEVDGVLNKMKERGSWRSGDLAIYTDLYDGTVAPLIRKGNIDGKWTKVQFSWFGMGTEVKVVDALDRSMFESGFLARFQWFIGQNIDVAEDDLGVGFGGESSYREQLDVIEKWREHFKHINAEWGFRRMTAPAGVPIIQPDSEETSEWFRAVTAKLEKQLFAGDPNVDILRPSISRTVITAAKFAALLAMADGRYEFTKDDLLVALWHCEELLGNLYYIANQVSSSDHAKQLDALYDYVMAHGPDCKSERIFRAMSDKFGLDVLTVERYRDELRAQNRISFVQNGQKHGWVATAVEQKED